MNYTELASAPTLMAPEIVVSKWYLKGFADGYRARRAKGLHWSAAWSAREQYKKGYAEGLAAARSDFAEAIRD
jgi:hypothetical protein